MNENDLIELYRQLAKLQAQVEFKDDLIKYLIAAIVALKGVVITLWVKISNRSAKDTEIINNIVNKKIDEK